MHVSHKHSFTLNLPLKHWIHFLLSSLWPPTSNILKEKKNTSCRMRNVSLLWTDEDLTLPNSNTVVVISTAQSLIRLTESWLCPLEIASQKSLMLTLCSEASPERRKIEKSVHFWKVAFFHEVSHLEKLKKYLVCWSIVALSYCINPVKKAVKTQMKKKLIILHI